ncbi:hypothetical protein B6S09_17690 [Oceanimonas baumannii]|uniref:Uncharacterized protein n=1 Tax=Oceanimonas baumannii TaxID=129578 RepID=A0A235C9I3_9GAMM|nr:hypothetical protein B6S09_17690 [Oceanimonas baumannii]
MAVNWFFILLYLYFIKIIFRNPFEMLCCCFVIADICFSGLFGQGLNTGTSKSAWLVLLYKNIRRQAVSGEASRFVNPPWTTDLKQVKVNFHLFPAYLQLG